MDRRNTAWTAGPPETPAGRAGRATCPGRLIGGRDTARAGGTGGGR